MRARFGLEPLGDARGEPVSWPPSDGGAADGGGEVCVAIANDVEAGPSTHDERLGGGGAHVDVLADRVGDSGGAIGRGASPEDDGARELGAPVREAGLGAGLDEAEVVERCGREGELGVEGDAVATREDGAKDVGAERMADVPGRGGLEAREGGAGERGVGPGDLVERERERARR